jgi:hypothetical protein
MHFESSPFLKLEVTSMPVAQQFGNRQVQIVHCYIQTLLHTGV